MKSKFILFIGIITLFQSCSFFEHTPDRIFGKAALNTNSYVDMCSGDLETMIANKEEKSLFANLGDNEWILQDNIELHLTTYKIPELQTAIKEIEELPRNSATKEMLDRSLIFFNFVLEQYQGDYLAIGKLVDSGVSERDVELAIINFERKNLPKFQEMHESLMEVAIPYAESNGIEVSRY